MRIMRMTSMPVLTSHNAWHQVHRLALRHFECCKGSQRVGKPLAPLPATRTTESSSQIATANSSIKECWAMITHKPGRKNGITALTMDCSEVFVKSHTHRGSLNRAIRSEYPMMYPS